MAIWVNYCPFFLISSFLKGMNGNLETGFVWSSSMIILAVVVVIAFLFGLLMTQGVVRLRDWISKRLEVSKQESSRVRRAMNF